MAKRARQAKTRRMGGLSDDIIAAATLRVSSSKLPFLKSGGDGVWFMGGGGKRDCWVREWEEMRFFFARLALRRWGV